MIYGLVKNLNLLERMDMKSKLLKVIISIKFIIFLMNLLIPYSIKANSICSDKLICKILINSLLGRFDLSIIKPITEIVSSKKRDFIISSRIIHSQTVLGNNKFLITYTPTNSKKTKTNKNMLGAWNRT
jgi:DNA polymerase type B, organellar and viral